MAKILVRDNHSYKYCSRVEGKKRYTDMICNQSEKGRHKAGARIGACHLHTDYGLGFIRAEADGG